MTKYLLPALTLAAVLPLAVQAQPGAGPGPAPAPGQGDPAKEFFLQFDANKDGSVSKDEFTKPQLEAVGKQLEQQFKFMDKDGNGKVDSAEMAAFMQEMQKMQEQMQSKMQGQPSGAAPKR